MSPKKAQSKPAGTTTRKTSATTAGKPAAKKSTTAKSTATTKKSASPGKKEPTYEEISTKAHEIYLERVAKGEPGNHESDWHKAVEILKAKK